MTSVGIKMAVCRLGGVTISVLVRTQGSRVEIWPRRWILKGDKNPQHTSLRRGRKAGGPMW